MQTSQLPLLPDEVIQTILEYTNPETALAVGKVSRRFRNVTNEPLLWRRYCLSEFRFWTQKPHLQIHNADAKDPFEWKDLFIRRSRTNKKVLRTLDSIIESQVDRTSKFETLIEIGYDAKEVLLQSLDNVKHREDYLARRHWSHATLSSIHRDVALTEWTRLKNARSHSPRDLERWFGAFDLFIRGGDADDIDSISQRLDQMTEQLCEEHPHIREVPVREGALIVAEFLLRHRIVGINSDREYHALQHNFLGIALSGNDHDSLPLISNVIYCAICSRLGFEATPCSFPGHVHSIISPRSHTDLDGKPSTKRGEPMFMDPFQSPYEVPISALHERLGQYPGISASPAYREAFLSPAHPIELTLRSARNILNSVNQQNIRRPNSSTPTDPRIEPFCSRYAAHWASILLSTPPQAQQPGQLGPGGTIRTTFHAMHHDLLTLLHIFASSFPYDASLVEKHLLPSISGMGGAYLDIISTIREMRRHDAEPKQPKLRSRYPHRPPDHVKYRIGQVFRHARYGYRAVITGWDAKCDAKEEWIESMGVDRLDGGREQSFYNALVLEDLSTRYVAQENIHTLAPPETDSFFSTDIGEYEAEAETEDETEDAEGTATVHASHSRLQAGDFALEVGQYFKRWDRERGVFVSNMCDEYPED